jgi:hypothetical protein
MIFMANHLDKSCLRGNESALLFKGSQRGEAAPVLALGVVRVASRRELGGLPLPLGIGVSPAAGCAERCSGATGVGWGDLQTY